jgi:hypothetical protein
MASADSRPYSFHKNLESNEICGLADTNDRPEFVFAIFLSRLQH